MDDLAPTDASISSAEPAQAVPPAVAAQMGALARAREITVWFLEQTQETARTLTQEEAKEAFIADGQMMLNVVRADRAIRQIVAMEQEVMGLRDPPTPRGGFGGQVPGGGGGGRGGERLNDLNDLNDLNEPDDLGDLEEVKDIHDLLAVEELSEIGNLDDYWDLGALEKHETYAEYERACAQDPANPWPSYEQAEEELNQGISDLLDRIAAGEIGPPEKVSDEEHRRRMQEMDAQIRAEVDEAEAKAEAEWRMVRAALLRRRAKEKEARKKHGRRSRGPP